MAYFVSCRNEIQDIVRKSILRLLDERTSLEVYRADELYAKSVLNLNEWITLVTCTDHIHVSIYKQFGL